MGLVLQRAGLAHRSFGVNDALDGCDWDVGEFSGGGAKRPAFALTACSYSLVIPASHKHHSREGGNDGGMTGE